MENKFSAFYIISKLLLCTFNNVLKGSTPLHLALQWKRKSWQSLYVTSVVNSWTVSLRREPLTFNERKSYLAVLSNCINCYREISNTFLKESAFVTDVTSSSFHLWLCSFLYSFSLPDCYLLTNLCQFTGTTFSWMATGGITGFPHTDKRLAIPSFHLLKWLHVVASDD